MFSWCISIIDIGSNKQYQFCTLVICLYHITVGYRHALTVPCITHDKINKMACAPSKNSDHPGPVWSESLLCDQCVAKESNFSHADSEDSDFFINAVMPVSPIKICFSHRATLDIVGSNPARVSFQTIISPSLYSTCPRLSLKVDRAALNDRQRDQVWTVNH